MPKPEQHNDQHRWRGIVKTVDPDSAVRSVRLAGGLCSWEHTSTTDYQLATTRLTLHTTHHDCSLILTDTTIERVLNTAARLGYQPGDLILEPLRTPTTSSPPPQDQEHSPTITR